MHLIVQHQTLEKSTFHNIVSKTRGYMSILIGQHSKVTLLMKLTLAQVLTICYGKILKDISKWGFSYLSFHFGEVYSFIT